MHALVQTLNSQHRAQEEVVRELDAALQAGDGSRVAEHLGRLRALLKGHFALETAQFYPALLERTTARPELLKVAEAFAQNMMVIGEGLMVFFRKYPGPVVDLAAFAADWRRTLEVLQQRMHAEEQTLHPLFDRLMAEPQPPGTGI